MKRSNIRGFTIIELAISMMVVGTIIAFAAKPYAVWQVQKKQEASIERVNNVALAIAAYRNEFGRYPCPAPFKISREASPYGYQSNCFEASTPAGACTSSGICVANSERTYSIDLDRSGVVEADEQDYRPRVIIGSIPFRDLSISEDFAYDSYGSRFMYAVTETQVNTDADYKYDRSTGGISIQHKNSSGTLVSAVSPESSIDFVVVSPGPNKMGSVNNLGVVQADGCDETRNEGENCDHLNNNSDSVFYVSGLESDSGEEFDDLMIYNVPLNVPLWARSQDNPDNIFAIDSTGDIGGNVGAGYLYDWHLSSKGTDVFGLNTKLWAGGDATVSGNANVTEFCDPDQEDCFPADMIGGVGISCKHKRVNAALVPASFGGGPSGNFEITAIGETTLYMSEDAYKASTTLWGKPVVEIDGQIFVVDERGFMVGIKDAAEYCGAETVVVQCPENQFVKQFANGNLVCQNLPCGEEVVASCSGSVTLPKANHDSTYTFYSGNAEDDPAHSCNKTVYMCENGEWSLLSDGGYCSCSAGTGDVETVSCGGSCTGAYQRRLVTNCSYPCEEYYQITLNNCSCGSGSGGGGGGGSGPSGPGCTPGSTQSTQSCGVGCTGERTIMTTTSCDPTNTTTSVVSDTCNCPPPPGGLNDPNCEGGPGDGGGGICW